MKRPLVINHAVYALAVNIILSTGAAAVNAWIGHISHVGIVVNISISVFVALLAYKIYHGSNGARYLYGIFYVITCLLFFGYIGQQIPDLRYWVKIIQFPINIFIFYCLFRPDSSAWFNNIHD